MPIIHASASVDAKAHLADDAVIEAGACVEADCTIGAQTVIGRNSIIWRGTTMGANNRIFPFCSIGGEPQDKKYAGEDAALVIGDNNTIREYVSINKGTAASGVTRIGSRNWIMSYVHIAHDCEIGDDVIIANSVQIAGHVSVGNQAVLGGGSLFHQFRRIGQGAMVGGGEAVRLDVPPYAWCAEGVVNVNREGMRRNGFSAEDIDLISRAYKILYRGGKHLSAAIDDIATLVTTDDSPLSNLLAFLSLPDLKLLRPRRRE